MGVAEEMIRGVTVSELVLHENTNLTHGFLGDKTKTRRENDPADVTSTMVEILRSQEPA